MSRRYMNIVSHLEACLERHGDTHRGVDWPNAEDVPKRHQAMLELIRPEDAGANLTLLDFGCGTSHFYEFLRDRGIANLEYTGLDISPKFLEIARAKFPQNTYYCVDVLAGDAELPRFDYVVMNGVFTERCDLSFEEMRDYFERMILAAFPLAARGLAFNVMSAHVDWERDDLFHLPFDTLAEFLTARVTRNFAIRSDYGLYEYTTYLYR